jgi:hypothetical protein
MEPADGQIQLVADEVADVLAARSCRYLDGRAS